ncbi:MAG TPA: hypothetical protein VFJ59_06100 [Pseudolabrys sp.]|nr:hypothetical protein [Pseudolabrys sp.]
MNEQIENLRLSRHDLALPPQFMPRDIDFKIGEAKIQNAPLLAARLSGSRLALHHRVLPECDRSHTTCSDLENGREAAIADCLSIEFYRLRKEAAVAGGLSTVNFKLGKGTL